MANHAGKEGTVTIGANTIAEVKEWSVEESGATTDSSSLDNTNNWDTHQHTRKSWTSDIKCFWDETDTTGQGAMTIGASVELKLYPEGSAATATYYEGTATVTSISRSAAFDGMVEADFSCTGNGALTESTVSA